VLEGTLRCGACGAAFSVRDGIPRMLPDHLSVKERRTSRAFGTEWKILGELSDVFNAEFQSYLDPLAVAELRGLAILDAGCGMGKFSLAAAQSGARAVIAVDLSEAVEVAHANLRHVPNVHVVQASIYELPFRPGTFDFVFSIGVLHHLPDPEKGFQQLVPLTAPDGRLLVWLYALEGNEFFVRWLDPFRTHVFSRLPSWPNRVAATLLAVPLWTLIKAVYAPLARRGLAGRLPYTEYFLHFSRLGFRTFWGTVYDKLVPPVSFYLTKAAVRRWLAAADLTELELRHRNGNSWTCIARRART
jgi:SAM-dependent methyltransferase